MDWLETLEPHYAWLALGLALAVLEIMVPGVFLIWLAGAALIVGVLTWFLPIGVPLQIVIFAVLAIASVFTGRRYLAANPVEPADPKMNDRGARLIGQTGLVVEPLAFGGGRVKIGDIEWKARGPDTAAGEHVRVSGCDGTTLLVEPFSSTG
jgi:membrane protein implicated in regulation of membrane protease activity